MKAPTKPPPPKPTPTITAGNENGRQEMRLPKWHQDRKPARHKNNGMIRHMTPSICRYAPSICQYGILTPSICLHHLYVYMLNSIVE